MTPLPTLVSFPTTTLYLVLLIALTIFATTTLSSTFTITPTTIDDERIPLKITWANINQPTADDVVVLYLLPAAYGKTPNPIFPVPRDYEYLNVYGYYKATQGDPKLTGSGQIEVPIFYPRDYAFYFEYLRVAPNPDAEKHYQPITGGQYYPAPRYEFLLQPRKVVAQEKLLPPREPTHDFGVVHYSPLILQNDRILCSQFHLAFTRDVNVVNLMYTTTPNQKDVLHFLHLTEDFEEINREVYNMTDYIARSRQYVVSTARPSATTTKLQNNDKNNNQNNIQQHHDKKIPAFHYQATKTGERGFYTSLQPVQPDNTGYGSYDIKDMTEFPANSTNLFVHPGYTRTINMTLPHDNTKYYYRIRNTAGKAISRVFTTYPQQIETKTTKKQDTDFFVFGDAGIGPEYYTLYDQQHASSATYLSIARMIKENQEEYGEKNYFTHILNIGDLSYSRGYAVINEFWFQQIQDVASMFPWMITMGNHEVISHACERVVADVKNSPTPTTPFELAGVSPSDEGKGDFMKVQGNVRIAPNDLKVIQKNYKSGVKMDTECSPFEIYVGNDSGGEAGVPWYRKFNMPGSFQYSPYGKENWIRNDQTKYHNEHLQRNIAYSYDVGYVHFIAISSEHFFDETSSQYEFVVKDLAGLNRTKTPFVIFSAHRPLYCVNEGCLIDYEWQKEEHRDSTRWDRKLRLLYTRLMEQYQNKGFIFLTITGHVHHASRTYPLRSVEEYTPITTFTTSRGVKKDVVFNKKGVQHFYGVAPIHLVSGAGGNQFDNPLAAYVHYLHPSITPNPKSHDTPNHIAARIVGVYGYYHVRANATHLTATFYNNQYDTIHDKFVIIDPSWEP